MRLLAKFAAGLLPLALAGCFHFPHHKQKQSQAVAPPITDDHPVTASIETVSTDLSPADNQVPVKPTKNIREKTQPIKRASRRKAQDTQQEVASNAAPAAVSAIGQLSSGNVGYSRSQAEESIASVEKGLNGIHRPLSDQEQKTVDHIREFLKQARAALLAGDVDGAQTLASKARVLLAELTK